MAFVDGATSFITGPFGVAFLTMLTVLSVSENPMLRCALLSFVLLSCAMYNNEGKRLRRCYTVPRSQHEVYDHALVYILLD